MVCHGQHTFVYSQLLKHIYITFCGAYASAESNLFKHIKLFTGNYTARNSIVSVTEWTISCLNCNDLLFGFSGHNVTAIIMGLNGSAAHSRASQALSSMLSRNALNPADITILFKLYSSTEPPPVELIRIPQFMGKLS